jgi:hypothetical protein
MRLVETSARGVCLFFVMAAALCAQQAFAPIATQPSATEQAALLARVRREALRYQRELPDFICLQLTNRSVDETGTGRHWKREDRFEVEDSYVERFVNHKLIMLNNKPPRKSYQQLSGFLSESILYSVGFLPSWLFGPQAKTDFHWSRSEVKDGRQVHVFTVHLDPSDSKFTVASERRAVMGGSTERRMIIAGIDGLLYVDAMTATVRRLEIRMILPPDSVIQEGTIDIDYASVAISERAFFLPVKFEVTARFGGTLGKNETEVVRYQKYAAQSTIHFDEPSAEDTPE